MFRASHKQWELAILILINTSASIKLKIVKVDNWLNLNNRPSGTRSMTLSLQDKPMNHWTILPLKVYFYHGRAPSSSMLLQCPYLVLVMGHGPFDVQTRLQCLVFLLRLGLDPWPFHVRRKSIRKTHEPMLPLNCRDRFSLLSLTVWMGFHCSYEPSIT